MQWLNHNAKTARKIKFRVLTLTFKDAIIVPDIGYILTNIDGMSNNMECNLTGTLVLL